MRKLAVASLAGALTFMTGHLLAQAQGRGNPGVFPAQQRPPGDPAVIERGKGIYVTTCTACHGADLRGGTTGGPNLLRSQVVLSDQHGELILPIVHGARVERGMPSFTLPDEDVVAVDCRRSRQAGFTGEFEVPFSGKREAGVGHAGIEAIATLKVWLQPAARALPFGQ